MDMPELIPAAPIHPSPKTARKRTIPGNLPIFITILQIWIIGTDY